MTSKTQKTTIAKAKTIFSGFGGQGVLMMGYVLATSGMHEDKHVTYLPSYGAEVRGGTANCTVTVSDEPIASPVASFPDLAVLMNTPSLIRFEGGVRSGGTVFLNSDLVDVRPKRRDIEVVSIPVNSIAGRLGNTFFEVCHKECQEYLSKKGLKGAQDEHPGHQGRCCICGCAIGFLNRECNGDLRHDRQANRLRSQEQAR
jgi:hypothetical protein